MINIHKKNLKILNLNSESNSILIPKPFYYENIVQVKRVTKVTTGGKKMTFKVIVIIGDKINNVGLGVGRSDNVKDAIEKASLNAQKHLLVIPLTTTLSIPHIIKTSYNLGRLFESI